MKIMRRDKYTLKDIPSFFGHDIHLREVLFEDMKMYPAGITIFINTNREGYKYTMMMRFHIHHYRFLFMLEIRMGRFFEFLNKQVKTILSIWLLFHKGEIKETS